MESHFQSDQVESWTNEKHAQFLNSIESSFVLSMFENRNHIRRRLDRFLEDSSDSTLDLKRRSGKNLPSSDLVGPKGGRMEGRDDKASKRRSSQPYDASTDQVVPQIEKRVGGGIKLRESTVD